MAIVNRESLPGYLRDANIRTSELLEDQFFQGSVTLDATKWATTLTVGGTIAVDISSRKARTLLGAGAGSGAHLRTAGVTFDVASNWVMDMEGIFGVNPVGDSEFFFGFTDAPGDPLAASDFIGFYINGAELGAGGNRNANVRLVSRVASGTVVNHDTAIEVSPDVAAAATPEDFSLRIDMGSAAAPQFYVNGTNATPAITFSDLSGVGMTPVCGLFSAAGSDPSRLDLDFIRIYRDKIA